MLQFAFHRMAQSNNASPIVPLSQAEQNSGSLGADRFTRIQEAREDMSFGKPRSIFNRICDFSYTQCADSSDKIYAFRALSAVPHNVQVDYTQPTIGCVFQGLSISYQDRVRAGSRLYEQAKDLLKSLTLRESQILPGLLSVPTDVLIGTFTACAYAASQPVSKVTELANWVNGRMQVASHASAGLLLPSLEQPRFVFPHPLNPDSANLNYFAVGVDLFKERVVNVYYLPNELRESLLRDVQNKG